MTTEQQIKAERERIAEIEKNYNGLLLRNQYVPFEILLKVFSKTDKKTLLTCQLVCKNWLELIRGYTWREKAESVLNEKLPLDKSWKEYFFIYDSQPFNKNLIRNHSGEKNHAGNNAFEGWTIKERGGNGWTIEKPPIGVPDLPDDPVFQGVKQCFVTSYAVCSKYQMINLVDEGFSAAMLDNLQPTIKVSEWFCSRHDCPAYYSNKIRLLGEKNSFIRVYKFRKEMRDEKTRNVWHKVTNYYKNYGPGLRKIEFHHTGVDRRNWDGYYGAKMAGASVELLVPTDKNSTKNKSERLKSLTESKRKQSADIWYPELHNSIIRPYVRNPQLRHRIIGGRVERLYAKNSRWSRLNSRRPFPMTSRYRY